MQLDCLDVIIAACQCNAGNLRTVPKGCFWHSRGIVARARGSHTLRMEFIAVVCISGAFAALIWELASDPDAGKRG
jgi:hypothetical protein